MEKSLAQSQCRAGNHRRKSGMKFICLGFHDEAKFAQMPQEDAQRMMDVCFAYDDELRRGGHFLGGEALESTRSAVTLRTRNGEVEVIDGPFAETKEMLGGILLLEARDLQHAIALVETSGSEDGEYLRDPAGQ
jgi:hypothetical protein